MPGEETRLVSEEADGRDDGGLHLGEETREGEREGAGLAREVAEGAELPSVECGVAETTCTSLDEEEPWVTARGAVFEHTKGRE